MNKTDSAFKNLVIGTGEVGTAIAKILECEGIDKGVQAIGKTYQYLHICFPYSERFVEYVKAYQEEYSPDYTIIHSTVPIGISRILGAVHSPVRGIHPHLEKGIRTFVKYFGGKHAYMCADQFRSKGIQTEIVPASEDTEALKLWDTTIYGLNILIEKEIYDFCTKNGVSFDLVYTSANQTYNEGYKKLGYPEFQKYILKHMPGPIGGHCVKENALLLDSNLAKALCE